MQIYDCSYFHSANYSFPNHNQPSAPHPLCRTSDCSRSPRPRQAVRQSVSHSVNRTRSDMRLYVNKNCYHNMNVYYTSDNNMIRWRIKWRKKYIKLYIIVWLVARSLARSLDVNSYPTYFSLVSCPRDTVLCVDLIPFSNSRLLKYLMRIKWNLLK